MTIKQLLSDLPEIPSPALEVIEAERTKYEAIIHKLRDCAARDGFLDIPAQDAIADCVCKLSAHLFHLIGYAYSLLVVPGNLKTLLDELRFRVEEFTVDEWEAITDYHAVQGGTVLIDDDEFCPPCADTLRLVINFHLAQEAKIFVSRAWQARAEKLSENTAEPAPPFNNSVGLAVAPSPQIDGIEPKKRRGRPGDIGRHRTIARAVSVFQKNWEEHLSEICSTLDEAAIGPRQTSNWEETWTQTLAANRNLVKKALQDSLNAAKKSPEFFSAFSATL